MSHKISSFSCLLAHLVSHALSASIKDSVHHRHAIPFLLSWSSSASYPLFPPLILASLTAWSKIAFGRDFLTSFLTVFGYRSSSRFLLLEIKVCPLVLRRWDHKLLSRKRKDEHASQMDEGRWVRIWYVKKVWEMRPPLSFPKTNEYWVML